MLSDEVYEQLSRMKGPKESFSDVIKRLLKYRPKLTEVAGSKTITVEDWRKFLRFRKIWMKREKDIC